MKKFANFMIDKRYIFSGVMLVLFIVSLFFIPSTKINSDFSKYLPDDSNMKQGLDIMATEFPDTANNFAIQVMFTDLPDENTKAVVDGLKSITNVKGVEYDDSAKYNKDNYKLFLVKCDYQYKEKEEIQIEKDIKAMFKEEAPLVQHQMYATTTIPLWVIIVAVVMVTIVLFVMTSTWLDPFVFLVTIGIAIGLNMGTNFIIGEISDSTYSISPILQLVLSMDYSVILMNHFRQEKAKGLPKIDAMKAAYASAMPSILSSGLTTVVGLLMLIFMRFTLGFNLGLVMAKGVLLSMICCLTILPTLILLLDKILDKTKKKQLHPHMTKIALYEHKHRYIVLSIFCISFILLGVFQSFTPITYAQVKDDKIGKVFPQDNSVVILYDNKVEEDTKYLNYLLGKEDKVTNVLGYMNTVGVPLGSKDMANALSQFIPDKEIPQDVVRAIYYNTKFNNSGWSYTLKQFSDELTNDVINNPTFKDIIDDEMKTFLGMFNLVTDKALLETKINAKALMQALNTVLKDSSYTLTDASMLTSAFMLKKGYINATTNNDPLVSLKYFINFSNRVVEDVKYKDAFSETFVNKIKDLRKYLVPTAYTTPVNFDQIASFIGISRQSVENVANALATLEGVTFPISIEEFLNWSVSDVAFEDQFEGNEFDKVQICYNNIEALNTDKLLTLNELMEAIEHGYGLDDYEANKQVVFASYIENNPNVFKFEIHKLFDYLGTYMSNDRFVDAIIPEDKRDFIININYIMKGVMTDHQYATSQLSSLLGNLDPKYPEEFINIAQMYLTSKNHSSDNLEFSIIDLLGYLSGDFLNDPNFSKFIPEDAKTKLKDMNTFVNDMIKQMRSDNYGLIVLTVDVPDEGKDTTKAINSIRALCEEKLGQGNYYIIGNSPMAVEMNTGFKADKILIEALTAIAIFIIVALTFKSFFIPLVLVLLVQCGVFLTIVASGLIGHGIYFVALLIVQCILMGATIDYGIVFTNYYINNRQTMGVRDAMVDAYNNSLHTILTSGLIIVLATGAIGLSPIDPAIGDICTTLSIGTLCSIILILFALPGLICVFDKIIVKARKEFHLFKKKKVVATAEAEATEPEAAIEESKAKEVEENTSNDESISEEIDEEDSKKEE